MLLPSRPYRIVFFLFLIIVLIGTPVKVSAASPDKIALAPITSGSDVIRAINAYRTQNGIPQLAANSLLSSLAQGQADYQASIQTVTHTGPGGTSPQDRATAAGYGGGNFFYLSEIIYGGTNAGINDAMTWWKNSSLHNSIMLAARYSEVGAAIAYSGDRAYFTAVLGGPTNSGSSDPGGSGSEDGSGSGNLLDPTDASFLVIPVQIATPQADGSVIHVVQQGQTIWTIEAIYELIPGTLRELNDIPSYPYVFPGDELLIRPASEAIETPAPIQADETNQKVALGTPFSYSKRIDATPTGTITIMKPTRAAAGMENREPAANDSDNSAPQSSAARYSAIAALLILAAVMIGSMFYQKSKQTSENDV
jgi:uncharacterized protein YkwD